MKIARFLLLCFIGSLLAMTSSCGRAAYNGLWGYTEVNYSAETFLNVDVARAGQSSPLGPGSDVSPPGTGGGDFVGVIGRMPKAVTISFTSKDKRQHSIYVVIPPRPGGYGSESPHIYFITESRCKAIATWKSPTDRGWARWYYAVRNHSADKVSAIKAIYPNRTILLTTYGLNPDRLARWLATDTLATDPMPQAVEMELNSPDDARHSVRVVLPAATHAGAPWPRVHLLIHSNGKITAKCTYPELAKPPRRWFCAVGDSGKEKFSHITVAGSGESYRLGDVGPKADTALGALGRMPKALELSFIAADGKRHRVGVQVPAPPASQGQQPEIYLIVKSPGKIKATYTCPVRLTYKPPPSWECTIMDAGAGKISHVTIAYKGNPYPSSPVADLLGPGTFGIGLTMNPEGVAPKTIDLGFTTTDGKRHTVHIVLPAFHGSGEPAFTLTIEKGGKVTATLTH